MRYVGSKYTHALGLSQPIKCSLNGRFLLGTAAIALLAAPAYANPAGGTVSTGSASISSGTNTTTVNQKSEGVVINWSSFNVGSGQTTNFVQPNSSAIAVNRIDSASASQILGTLDANGRIVLINGNGVLFGKDAQVNVGSLIATSTDGSDSDVLSGKFTKAGNQSASVVNRGTITAASGGTVALVAPNVSNSGIVQAKLGTVSLGAANAFTVDLNGDGLVSFAAQGDVNGKASAINTGRLVGANVAMTAHAAEDLATGVVTTSGIIQAEGVSQSGGTIFLDAGNGTLTTSGTLNAAGAVGGGKIETSGANVSIAGQITAGKGGKWVIDPDDLTIDQTAATTIDASLNSGNAVELQTTATTSSAPPGNATSGIGDINIDSALSWSTSAMLTIDAYHSINILAPISITGAGQLVLQYNDECTDGALDFGLSSAGFTGNISYGPTNNGGTLEINGNPYILEYSLSSLATDISGGEYFALANSYNAGGDGTYSSPVVAVFTGTFNGLGNTISNLTINTSAAYAGLFGQIFSGGTVENVGLVGVSVTDTANSADVGGLAGYNDGTIADSYATGAFIGAFEAAIGGLVGMNDDFEGEVGIITGSYATGTVSGSYGGGLVGWNAGSIVDSYAMGGINSGLAGGLVGWNDTTGMISDSYATGTVTGSYIGGLVGYNDGTISNAYATAVATWSGGPGSPGGLVGYNDGTITNGYWDTITSHTFVGVGSGPDTTSGVTTAQLANATTLAVLNSNGTAWGNVGNQTTPYLLSNPGPVNVGTDSSATPAVYNLVFNMAQLQNIDNALSENYALAQDIDATGTSGFVPLGGGITAFTGIFDGLGNTISNLTIVSSAPYAGLFGQLGSGGTVENIGLVGGSVTDTAGGYVGGLVGYNSGAITGSYTTGAVSGGEGTDIGGLVGFNDTDGTIANAYATGAISGDGGDVELGGLVGYNEGTIANAYATAAVTEIGDAEPSLVGGLVGNNQIGTITDVYATGAVMGTGTDTLVGGLVGFNSSAITNAYATGAVSGSFYTGGLAGYSGGGITNGYWDVATSGASAGVGLGTDTTSQVTTAQLANATTLAALNSNGTAWSNVGNQITPYLLSNPGPVFLATDSSTTPAVYNVIANVQQLQNVNNALSGYYVLGQNIDASGYSGFAPIGESGSGFTGIFNGLGNTISNLTISSSGAYGGLFGQIGSGGTVENVGLVGGSVTNTAAPDVGGPDVNADVGGLAGYNNGTITGSYTTGAVSGGNSASVGGLVGYNDTAGTVSESYATGAIAGVNSSFGLGYVGGLVGANEGAIANAYATGSATITGGDVAIVGGLVGLNDIGATITDVYATGAVTGTGTHRQLDGLVGLDVGGLANGYWDTATSGIASGYNGSGTTTAGLASAAVLAALNSNGTVWGNAGNQTTPYLLSNLGPVFLGTDSAATPAVYNVITDIQQLQAVNNALSVNYVLAQNIDATGTSGFVPLGESTVFTGVFDGLGNTISNLTINSGATYAGLFGQVGSGGTVENVGLVGGSVTDTSGAQVGALAGYNGGGTIANVYATGSVTGGTGANVGGLVGFNDIGSTITNAYATGAVGGVLSGGLVGENAGAIADSYATGSVSGSYAAGGLAGKNDGSITDAYATGAVSGGGYEGGLAGGNGGTITDTYATGALSGGSSTGGLVGYGYSGTIADGYWDTTTSGTSTGVGSGTGSATPETTAGLASSAALSGLNADGTAWGNAGNRTTPYLLSNIGQVYAGTDSSVTPTPYNLVFNITQLQNIDTALPENYALAQNIDASGYSGFTPIGESTAFTGIFNGLGYTISNLTISSGALSVGLFGQVGAGGTVENVGLVGGSVTDTGSGSYYAGSLVGYNDGTIADSYETGAMNGGNALVGGLVGENYHGTITDSYATGAVSGSDGVGGLVGGDSYGTITDSYATGAVSGGYYMGGLAAETGGGTITDSYATGAVGAAVFAGGFIGDNYDTITNDYWDTTTSGTSIGIAFQGGSSAPTPETTAGLASSAVLTVLNSNGTAWGNVGNRTTPYLLSNIGPVYLGTDSSVTPTPYNLVFNITQLQNIDNNLSANYLLAQNIDASGTAGFTPIGESTAFTGIFNGLGNTISNLTINSGATYAGLFGQIGAGGTVENIGLAGGTVTDGSSNADVGGLAGYNFGTIVDAYATGSVTGGAGNVGGLVGYNDSGSTITDAYATGAVSGGSNANVGGLVGFNGSATVANSYATGTVGGGSGSSVGGFIGDNGGTISNGYWDTTTSGTHTGIGTGIGTAIPETTAGLASATVLTALNSSGAVWGNLDNQTTPYLLSNPGPVFLATDSSATPAAYNLIFNTTQLQNINNALADNYLLAQDIDATGTSGFTPIGESTAFTGIFDGLGNTISNLTINSSATYAGLFGQVGSGGTVENVGLVGGSVTDTSGAQVGALAGYNGGGTIANVYATGSVTGGTGANVGGLVGFNDIGSTITNAYATGAVGGVLSGGLVGENAGAIADSYATGSVSGSYAAGGLAGKNDGSITDAYATGAVSGGGYEGGLAGGNGGTITDTYATGALSGGSSTGGLVGYVYSGTIANSYWDTTTSGTSIGIGSGFGSATPETTAGLAISALLTALNSGGVVWDNLGNQTTPYLLSNIGAVYLGTDSSVTPTPYNLVFNITQLQNIDNNLSANYLLAQNIDASGTAGFTPIGESTAFTGIFNGLGNTISNLTINSGATYAGLFGQVGSGGTVENVGLVGGSVTDSTGTDTGGLAGYNAGAIVDAYETAAVNGGAAGNIGGLVGSNSGTIDQSFASGAVSGTGSLGGLVGYNSNDITDTYATGAVSAGTVTSYVGGLAGENLGTILNAYATGLLSTGDYTGGVVGFNGGGLASKAYWDTGTTGIATDNDGATAQTTAELQGGGLPNNFSGTVWGIIPGVSYPYLNWQFAGTPQVVSGKVYAGTTAVANDGVGLLVGGNSITPAVSMASGANGYYYLLLAPGTISGSGSDIVTYLTSGTPANTFVQNATESLGGVTLVENTFAIASTASDSNAILAGLPTALGSASGPQFLYTASSGIVPGVNLVIFDTAPSFTLDSALDVGDATLTLYTSGSDTQNGGAITANELESYSTGGLSLTSATNSIAEIGTIGNVGTGGIAITDSAALTVAGIISTGSASNGAITLTTTGTGNGLTINGHLTGGTVDLVSGGIISEGTTGYIDASTLDGSSDGYAYFLGRNKIGALGNFATGGAGSLDLYDFEALDVTGTVNTGKRTAKLVDEVGNLKIDGTLEGGTVTLDSVAGEVQGAGTIDAKLLNVTADTGIDLDGTNDITTIGTDTTASGPNVIDKN